MLPSFPPALRRLRAPLLASTMLIMTAGSAHASAQKTLFDIFDIASNLSDLSASFPGSTGDSTRATGTVNGRPVTISTPVAFSKVAGTNDITANINGDSVRFTTTAESFKKPDASTITTLNGTIDRVQINASVKGDVIAQSKSNVLEATVNGSVMRVELPSNATFRTFKFETDVAKLVVDGKEVYTGVLGAASKTDLARIGAALGLSDAHTLTRIDTQRAAVDMSFDMVSNRIDGLMTPQALRAGSASGTRIGTWADASYEKLKSDRTGFEYDGSVAAVSAGFDAVVSGNLVVGIAIGTQQLELDTPNNNGTLEVSGPFVAPYAAYGLMGNRFVVDASALYARLDGETTRGVGSATLKGEFDTNRYAGRVGATYNHEIGKSFMLSGDVHVTAGRDAIADWTEDGTKVKALDNIPMVEVSTGVKASYAIDNGSVYGGISYHHDALDWFTDNLYVQDDRDNRTTAKVGIQLNLTEKVSAGVEAQTSLFDQDRSSYGVSASVRYRF
jgi:outer membrane autotransporter protein